MAVPAEKVSTQTDIKHSSSDPPSINETHSKDVGVVLTHDEYHLATLGYKQEFIRSLGFFESWAATFTSMNFISGIPVLFGWVMYTGGPKAAFANWTMIGGLSCIVSLVMAELAASLPTTGEFSYPVEFYWGVRKLIEFLRWHLLLELSSGWRKVRSFP